MPETVLNWNDFPVAPAPFSCVKDLWRWPRAGRHIGILVGNGLPGAGRMAFWGGVWKPVWSCYTPLRGWMVAPSLETKTGGFHSLHRTMMISRDIDKGF